MVDRCAQAELESLRCLDGRRLDRQWATRHGPTELRFDIKLGGPFQHRGCMDLAGKGIEQRKAIGRRKGWPQRPGQDACRLFRVNGIDA